MWESVVLVMCLNRRSQMLITSTKLLGQNYQHLTASAYMYVCLCSCVSANQPLVIIVANHLDTACSSLLDMCKKCRAQRVETLSHMGKDTIGPHWPYSYLGIGLELACNGGSCGGISLKRD